MRQLVFSNRTDSGRMLESVYWQMFIDILFNERGLL